MWEEEQFGPILAVHVYDDERGLDAIVEYARAGKYAQQVSLYTGGDAESVSGLVDAFRSIFGKININVAAGRSPDDLAFSGRRSSAMGTMSVRHALEAFTTETVVATKRGGGNEGVYEQALVGSVFAEDVTGG